MVLTLAFLYGVAVGWRGVWPYELLRTAYDHVHSIVRFGKWEPSGRLIAAPEGASGNRFVVERPDLLMPGFRAIMGWSGHDYRIWLFDAGGQEVHAWPIDYKRLDPDGPVNGADEPHGMAILNDGSVLVNFDFGDVLARLDPCGKPVWINKGIYHHSIEVAENGTYWTWRSDGSPYGHYHYLTNFDAETGQVITELNLIDDFINKSAEQAAIFGVPPGYEFKTTGATDIFHPNDIEELRADIADRFPQFAAGDLLVSFRNLHLVTVLDPNRKVIKWWSHGPWRFQHDPGFTSDGRIIVYSNNSDHQHSSIISIDPASREIDVAFTSHNIPFFSKWAGKLDPLPNGNILFAIPEEGRVIEATWPGEIVFEFNNYISERAKGYILDAKWIPNNFFTRTLTCQ